MFWSKACVDVRSCACIMCSIETRTCNHLTLYASPSLLPLVCAPVIPFFCHTVFLVCLSIMENI